VPFPYVLLPSRCLVRFFLQFYRVVSKFLHFSRAVVVAGMCEENWYCCRERRRLALFSFSTCKILLPSRPLCVNLESDRIVPNLNHWIRKDNVFEIARLRIAWVSLIREVRNHLRILLSRKLIVYRRRRFWWCML